jgi:mannitol/fructose-specific phosphotransferase system IIA component (Ntr-type)
LRVLANLSRRLMHDDFRDRVMREEDAPALCAFIAEAIRA